MIDFPDFRSVETTYIISNTPTFLARKLREDEEVIRFARATASKDLLEALDQSTKVPPADFRSKYIPLVLIAALSSKGDRQSLRLATAFDRNNVRWFNEILDYLLQVTPANNHNVFDSAVGDPISTSTFSRSSINSVKL